MSRVMVHQVLGLREWPTQLEVEITWKRLAVQLHPDKVKHLLEAYVEENYKDTALVQSFPELLPSWNVSLNELWVQVEKAAKELKQVAESRHEQVFIQQLQENPWKADPYRPYCCEVPLPACLSLARDSHSPCLSLARACLWCL